MIISAGYNIAAPEVEEALLGTRRHECAVIGVADEARGHAREGVRRARRWAEPLLRKSSRSS
jgi:acyl-coenzyme A synthetase/AMP-(fatty) acid ligase